MKINSINIINRANINKTRNVVKDVSKSPETTKDSTPIYGGVSFGIASTFYLLDKKTKEPRAIKSKVSLNSGKTFDLNISSGIINAHLLDKKGVISDRKVNDFVSIYEQTLEHFVSKSEREVAFLNEIANGRANGSKKSNIIYMNPNDEARQALMSTLMSSEEDPLFSFFDKMQNPMLRRDYARDILSDYVITDEDFQNMAMKGTLRILSISKQQNGYDLSDMNKKIELVEMLEKLENEYAVDNVAEQFIDSVKDGQGKVDFNFANSLSRLIQNSGVYIPELLVSHRAEIIRKFVACDEENADEVMQGITKLSTIYEVDDSSDAFELVFSEAFNPLTEKYDEQAFSELFSIVANVITATDSIGTCDESEIDELTELQVELIQDYFSEIRDENTGRIKDRHISPQEYLSKKDI